MIKMTKRIGWLLALAAFGSFSDFAQTEHDQTAFEVASVRRSNTANLGNATGSKVTGGPGTEDPSRFSCRRCPVLELIMKAYSVPYYQVAGPNWISIEDFDISATLSGKTSPEQFRVMLQRLLAERFNLLVHRETKNVPAYSLLLAKGGARLKRHEEETRVETPQAIGTKPARPVLDKDGYPILSQGISAMMHNDRMRLQASGESMSDLAHKLAYFLSEPVIEETELQGKYDFTLSWVFRQPASGPEADSSIHDESSEPTLFNALREQLGLRLERRSGRVGMVIVDHVDRIPTEN
jgi:uncharacterized protein (TIGR03435 family)